MNNIYIKIDSSNRDTGSSSSSYTINLTDPLSTGTYKLHYFHMPLSIYNVTSNNNKIYFYENSSNRTGTITPGIYSSLDITTAIKTAMDAASTDEKTYLEAMIAYEESKKTEAEKKAD